MLEHKTSTRTRTTTIDVEGADEKEQTNKKDVENLVPIRSEYKRDPRAHIRPEKNIEERGIRGLDQTDTLISQPRSSSFFLFDLDSQPSKKDSSEYQTKKKQSRSDSM